MGETSAALEAAVALTVRVAVPAVVPAMLTGEVALKLTPGVVSEIDTD